MQTDTHTRKLERSRGASKSSAGEEFQFSSAPNGRRQRKLQAADKEQQQEEEKQQQRQQKRRRKRRKKRQKRTPNGSNWMPISWRGALL